MPSSRIREIPIFREADQRQSRPASERSSSPASCPQPREIPIQRDTGVSGQPFDDFFHREDRGWADPWPDRRGGLNSSMFDSEPFSRSSGFHSRAGIPGFPSHIRNDFGGGRHSPVQRPFPKHPGDPSSARRVESPVTTSQLPQQPVTVSEPPQQQAAAESIPVSQQDEPKPSVPIVVEPAVSEAPPLDVPPSAQEAEAKNDETDASLHVEEPQQRARSPSPAPPNMTPLEIIEQVLAEAAQLEEEVKVYAGGRKEKSYLRLEELLTRLLLKLDRIESEGREDIRSARREAVHAIESILGLLESRTSQTATKQGVPSADSGGLPENSSSDSTSKTNSETTRTSDIPKDGEQTKNDVNTAAVKEMVLGSEVPC